MNTQLSEKLRIATFVATCLVVLRHSANWMIFFQDVTQPQWIASLELKILFCTDVAVPFFFFVSGFFFMRYSYYGIQEYAEMLKKKFRVLLIPFIIWNIIGGLLLLIHDPEGHFGNSWQSCIVNFCMSHWYGPLWYVRDVIILMLLWPVYGWMYSKYFQPLLIALIIYIMCTRWWVGGIELLSGEGLVFFLLGGWVQKHSSILEYKTASWIACLMILLWISSSFCLDSWDQYIHQACLVVGLLAFWFSLDLVQGKVRDWCLRLAPYSFLIYVTHFYLQKTIKYCFAHCFPENEYVAFALFFLMPAIVIPSIIWFGMLWKKYFPKSYSICMGGRG